jgi:hypothetical protein
VETIKSELGKNKIKAKRKMRNKWSESENATLQLAAYKLIAEKEELDALTMNKLDHAGGIAIQQITGMEIK